MERELCPDCEGSGMITTPNSWIEDCPACNGTGEIDTDEIDDDYDDRVEWKSRA